MADWGYTGTGDTDVALTNHVRVNTGQFSPGAGTWQLDSMSVRGGTNAVAGSRRAVYNNSVNDIDGAALVEDLGAGALSSNTWSTINSASNPALSNGDHLGLFVKGTNGSGSTRKLNASLTGSDFATYWEGSTGISADETVAYPATAGAESFTVNEAHSYYITYSASGGSSGNPWYHNLQQQLLTMRKRLSIGELIEVHKWLPVRLSNGLWAAKRRQPFFPKAALHHDVPFPSHLEVAPRYSLLVPVGVHL